MCEHICCSAPDTTWWQMSYLKCLLRFEGLLSGGVLRLRQLAPQGLLRQLQLPCLQLSLPLPKLLREVLCVALLLESSALHCCHLHLGLGVQRSCQGEPRHMHVVTHAHPGVQRAFVIPGLVMLRAGLSPAACGERGD